MSNRPNTIKVIPRAKDLIAVILAGGLGTRVRTVLAEVPKPMAPVRKKPFLEWVVRYLAVQGFKRIVISTGYRGEVIERHFKDQLGEGISVKCLQEPAPLGTAGAFRFIAKAVNETPEGWLVLNGDSLALTSLEPLVRMLDDAQISGAVLGVSTDDASRYGSLAWDDSNNLVRFVEKRPGSGLINAGVYLLRPLVLPWFPDKSPLSFETDVFPVLTAGKGKLKVCFSQAPFLDIGTPESLGLADAFLQPFEPLLLSI